MKTRAYFLLAVLVFTLIRLPVVIAQSTPPPVEREWNVDGTTRKALLYVPASVSKEKAPVVFAFHGHGGSMQQAARSFAIQREWPDAVVVYPQGLNTPGKLTDPEGRRAGWQSEVGTQKDRDIKFFDAVLASLKSDYKVDESRLFAMGHSNGGSFTYVLWASRGKLFRAIVVSGSVPGVSAPLLTPKPVLHLAGKTDPLVRFPWQWRAMENIKRLNACSTDGTPWAKSGTLVATQYPSKIGTPLVTLIHPDGHTFPAEAPALIVQFFKSSMHFEQPGK